MLFTPLFLFLQCFCFVAADTLKSREPQGSVRVWSAMSTDLVDHVYSTNESEVKYLCQYYGFSIEGKKGTTTGYIHTSKQPHTIPLFRLYAIGLTDHFLTNSTEERDYVIKRLGYHLEGILGYVYTSSGPGLVPLYRLHNAPAHDHYYTTSDYEMEDAARNGWAKEGVVGYLNALEEDAPVMTVPTMTPQEPL